MKNKAYLLLLFTFLLESCVVPSYLPTHDQIDVHPHGSHITVISHDKQRTYGELISINSDILVVLTTVDQIKECVVLPVSTIDRFILRYAKPSKYEWSIPLFTLVTLSHGYYSIITGPINIIITTGISIAGENAFRYKETEISIADLGMFARFPQGIPFEVDVADIK